MPPPRDRTTKSLKQASRRTTISNHTRQSESRLGRDRPRQGSGRQCREDRDTPTETQAGKQAESHRPQTARQHKYTQASNLTSEGKPSPENTTKRDNSASGSQGGETPLRVTHEIVTNNHPRVFFNNRVCCPRPVAKNHSPIEAP